MRNKVFVSINILGLGIAMACTIVGYFCYDFNRTFDRVHKNASSVYRVNSWRVFQNQKTKFAHVPLGLGNAVAINLGDVEGIIRYSTRDGNFRVGQTLFNSEINFVDTSFFKTFTFNFIEGTGSLSEKTNIIISESLSKKLFAEETAIGKTIEQILDNGKSKIFAISGVFYNPPSNSSFKGELYANFYNHNFDNEVSWNEDSWSYRTALFVNIPDATRIPQITSQLNRYIENNNRVRADFIISNFELEPFYGMGVRDEYYGVHQSYTRSGFPPMLIIIVGAIGSFILLITCFNLINTFIALSTRRLKEIGIRKVMGGSRKSLIIQFMGETISICVVALVLGLFIADYVLIPAFNEQWPNLKLYPSYFDKPDFLVFAVLIVSLTALIAGSYPALYISKFNPIVILKGKLRFGRNSIITYALLTFQFSISLLSLICGLAFINNSRFQQEFDLGFDKNGLAYAEVASRSEFELYKNALIENPDIISIAGSRHHLGARTYHTPIKYGLAELQAQMLDVGDDYLKTAGLTLVEGRDFTNESETERRESVIVTEETVRQFGWTNALGMQITLFDTIKLTVIGVVRNIYNNGLWKELEPMAIRKAEKDAIYYTIVRAQPGKIAEVNGFMGKKWTELFPDRIYEGRTIDNGLSEAFRVNSNVVKMSTFLGIVVLLLSVTGLFTLVSLNINSKMKEIGVRKVLGSSAAGLSWTLNRQFVLVVLFACLAGGSLGSFIVENLLSDLWKYYQPVTTTTILASIIALTGISILFTIHKIYGVVRLNPADILRDE